MNEDVTLRIGGDNTPLQDTLGATTSIVSRWSQAINDEIDSEVARSLESATGQARLLGDELSNMPVEDVGARFARLGVIFTGIVGIAAAIYQGVIRWETEQSGLNEEIEQTKTLEQELLDIQKERLRLRSEQAQDEINSGEQSQTLEQLREELEVERANVRQAQTSRLEAEMALREAQRQQDDLEDNTALGTPGLSTISRFIDVNGIREAQERFDRFADAPAQARERVEALEKAIAELNEAQENADSKRTTDQENVNAAIEREIALRQEATLRANGDTDQADELRIERERRENASRLGQAGADRIAAAEREQQAAERAAETRRQSDRDAERSQRERDRERETAENRLSRLRQQGRRQVARDEERIQRLADREAAIDRRRRTPIGGFDRGFGSFSDRIASSAAGPDPDAEERRALKAETERVRMSASREHAERLAAIRGVKEEIMKINTGMTS